ncbi:MAG: hypothetical protein VW709_04195 [Rickettsiales bacterium]
MTGALVPATQTLPAFEEIVAAFVARDYVAASRAADALIHQTGPIQCVQLALISLCRSGNGPKAHWYGQIVIDRRRPNDPWSADLVALSIGKVGLEDVIQDELNDTERCQASYYAGAAKMSAGLAGEAEALFDACIEINASCLELYLAAVDKAALSSEV